MDVADLDRFRTRRCGQKLTILNDSRVLTVLPPELQEKAWLEILQKEEVDLFIFEIREEILEEAMKVCYEKYMKKQVVAFTIDCAVRAWLKLIDWHFYRHDPGDERYASPACFIPNSEASWIPDKLPSPSPKDSWANMDSSAECDAPEELVFDKSSSASSLAYPVVEKISPEYQFPGKVQIEVNTAQDEILERTITYNSSSFLESSTVGSSSEVLERITDYPVEEQSASQVLSDEFVDQPLSPTIKREKTSKSKNKPKKKSKTQLPPLEGPLPPHPSAVTMISDCKLRTLRLETKYEISSEHPVDDSRKKKK